ncbi:MAG: DUF1674 domain-containing protein [Alphaproteobacteria bacterium]|nr:DUF1674 domain-containing protein [Alphaproteobacteria bacterium]
MSGDISVKNLEPTEENASVEVERRDLPAAAVRALAEAAQRSQQRGEAVAKGESSPKELGGPKGEEPTRYGDWERGGRAVDF